MLRVWLPLTKDLRNQGLDNVTVTNNGATFNSAGKLGGCYSFDGSDDFISLNGSILYDIIKGGSTPFSIAMWVYRADSTRAILFGDYSLSGSIGFNIELTTAHKLRFYWNGSPDVNTSAACTLSTWSHVAIVYDGTKICFYVNGSLDYTYTVTLSTKTKTTGLYYIGRDNRTGSTAFNGKLNDVRIYDHCLSPMEVKELAKGLVLHYPLNRQGWGQENLVVNTSPILRSGSIAQYYAELGHNSTDFFGLTTGNIATFRVYLKAPAEKKVKARIQFYTDGNNRISINGNWINAGDEGYSTITWTLTAAQRAYSQMQLLCDCNDGTTTTDTFYWKEVKLEEGSIATPWCPNSSDTLATTMGLNSTIEYDCSGFCNNGTRIGTFSWTSDTPKYQVSQNFTSPGTIQVNNFSPNSTDFKNSYTIATWIKTTTTNGMICGGLNSCYDIWIYNNSIYLNVGDGSSTSNAFLNNGTKVPISVVNNGQWHHVVVTGNGSTAILYVDGYEKGRAGTYRNFQCTTLYINGWNTGNEYHFNGQMSDFRIYATALSASDVKSLYQNSAYIDSSGNVYGAVHSEV